MVRALIDFTNFREMAAVSELARVSVPLSVSHYVWTGTGSSLQPSWDGHGQCVRGPSNLTLTIPSSGFASLGVRGRARFTGGFGSAQDVAIIRSGVAQDAALALNSSNQLVLNRATGVSSSVSSTIVPVLNEWYEFEWAWYLHNTVGRWRVMWGNQVVSDLSAINQDTIYSGASTLDKIAFHNPNIDIADPVIWAVIGKFDDRDFCSYPGRTLRINSLRPRAAGAFSGWTNVTNTGAEDYEEVDEVQHDGGTSRIRANLGDQRESFAMEQLVDATAHQVFGLRSQVSHANELASSQMSTFLRHGGTNYDRSLTSGTAGETGGSPSWAWVSAWFRAEHEATVPGTATAWEDYDVQDALSVINGTELGMKQVSSLSFRTSVSQAVLHVLYSTSPPEAPKRINASIVRFKKNHRLTKTWRIIRRDEIELAFCDHDKEIELDGVAFQPAGGFSGSAIRRELLLKSQNQSLVGVVSSDAITEDDLRAGRYRDAVIVERVVDGQFPWLGDAQRNVYWVGEVEWSKHAWRAEVYGLAQRLERHQGIVISRSCRNELFDHRCLVDPTAFTYTGISPGTVTNRRDFLAGIALGSFADDFFAEGDVVWTTGANAGVLSEVRVFTGSNKRVQLYLKTPFDIQTSDTFTIRAGCDKLFSTCGSKFSNRPNFRGHPFIPGRNKAQRAVR